jgi:hypothetical protein
VLTSRRAGTTLAAWAAAQLGVAVILPAASFTPAQAADVGVSSCVGGYTGDNCVSRWGPAVDPYVREIPEPIDAAEKAHREARDHKWLARCRPVIEPGRLGVRRYRYSAPGCEFGVTED